MEGRGGKGGARGQLPAPRNRAACRGDIDISWPWTPPGACAHGCGLLALPSNGAGHSGRQGKAGAVVGAGEARGWRCEHRPAAAGGGERKTRGDGEKRGEERGKERRGER